MLVSLKASILVVTRYNKNIPESDTFGSGFVSPL